MKLPAQLIVVSLLALLLPWAGCSYVAQMEAALRENDQQNLLRFGGAIASVIESQPALLDALVPVARDGGAPLYLQPLAMAVDGYLDEGLDTAGVLTRWTQAYEAESSAPLQAELVLGRFGRDAYLYVAVNDSTPSLFSPAAPDLAAADRVGLLLGRAADGSAARTVWLLQESPGQFVARRELDGRLLAEYNLRAQGSLRPGGYVLELSFPYEWLNGFAGVRVHDAADARRFAGTVAPGAAPGPVIEQSAALERALQGFSEKFDWTVVDREQWVRAARSGEQSREPVARAPGAWLLEWFYRRVAGLADESTSYAGPQGGKLLREEVSRALLERGFARWYRAPAGRDAGVGYDGETFAGDYGEAGLVDGSGGQAAILSAAVRIYDAGRDRVAGAVVVERSSSDILSLTNRTLVNIAGVSGALWLVMVGGLLGYAVWLSLRIRRLNREVAEVLAPDGRELRALPPQTAGDEIGELGRSFAQLLGRVRGYNDYLRSLGSKLSHELRTPLAVVSSSLDNLEHESLPASSREYLARARAGSDRLGHILMALSEASRVEQAIAAADTERLELRDWLAQVTAGYSSAFPELLIETVTGEEPLYVQACPELLAQLLDKLMDNARDFCPIDGTIRFVVERVADEARLVVENDGPPLPAGLEDKLFESMVSARSGRDDVVHLGLGLNIVRLIAEFHGGSVRAANRPDGKGVRVTVSLPLSSGSE